MRKLNSIMIQRQQQGWCECVIGAAAFVLNVWHVMSCRSSNEVKNCNLIRLRFANDFNHVSSFSRRIQFNGFRLNDYRIYHLLGRLLQLFLLKYVAAFTDHFRRILFRKKPKSKQFSIPDHAHNWVCQFLFRNVVVFTPFLRWSFLTNNTAVSSGN